MAFNFCCCSAKLLLEGEIAKSWNHLSQVLTERTWNEFLWKALIYLCCFRLMYGYTEYTAFLFFSINIIFYFVSEQFLSISNLCFFVSFAAKTIQNTKINQQHTQPSMNEAQEINSYKCVDASFGCLEEVSQKHAKHLS